MKTCFKCGRALLLEEFYRHPMMADGHLGKCKDCTRADVRANRAARRDYYQQYDWRRYRDNPERWNGKSYPRDQRRIYDRPWRERYPEKRRAQWAAGNAVRDGRLKRQPCEVCGAEKTQGHHDDYSKPLDVRWLCVKHHHERHRREAS